MLLNIKLILKNILRFFLRIFLFILEYFEKVTFFVIAMDIYY